MKANEFLKEVMESEYKSDDFPQIYSEFQKFQSDILNTLTEFHRVCELNNINYELAFGSLLGLIRDGGQIPWDYDIDVIVAFEDKERLIKALQKDLSNKHYFYCPDVNKRCRHMIMRVSPIEYRTEAIHVDVFFMIGTPEDEEERRKFAQRITKLSRDRYGKLVNLKEEALGNYRRFISIFLKRKLPTLFCSIRKINQEYEKLCSQYSSKTASYCISADTFASWRDYPTSLLWETKVVEADYGEIRIPVHFEELLSLIYGDYKKIPPLEKRIQEVRYNHLRIKQYEGKPRIVSR